MILRSMAAAERMRPPIDRRPGMRPTRPRKRKAESQDNVNNERLSKRLSLLNLGMYSPPPTPATPSSV